MPLVSPGSVEYVLMSFSVDMGAMNASAVFHTLINATKVGEVSIGVGSADLAQLLQTQPEPGKSRADDITDAIYRYAKAQGILPGEIV